jgi:sigma-E factor negative regulatory protein RseA
MLAGSGGLYGRQGGAQLAALSPNAVVAAAPAASLGLSQPVSVGEETAMPLGSEAQSSTVVAVAGPNGQTMMLRDPRLDELLASHPQQSSAPNLQMPASFLRNASFATATRH